jgi:hypothetical protein
MLVTCRKISFVWAALCKARKERTQGWSSAEWVELGQSREAGATKRFDTEQTF